MTWQDQLKEEAQPGYEVSFLDPGRSSVQIQMREAIRALDKTESLSQPPAHHWVMGN